MYFSDLVYSDTNENWFSPHGWPERQLHPGMGMHIVSTWIFAYHFLHLTGTYCSLYPTNAHGDINNDRSRYVHDSVSNEGMLKNDSNLNSLFNSIIRKEKEYNIPSDANGGLIA